VDEKGMKLYYELMRILVTGGGGFLGSHIIKELLKNPSYIVTNFSRHLYPELEDLGVPTIRGDLRNINDIERALSQGFEAIFHVAALPGVWGKYSDFFDVNFTGTKLLLEVARKKGIKKLIYTSTPSVVFNKKDLLGVGEEQPYATNFLNAYTETKTMAEKLVLEMNDGKDFLTCAIRPHLIWGPGDPHLFPRLIQRGRQGKLRVVGDGENLVDIIFVENAALAHVLAFEHLKPGSPVCGKAYFVGQERPVNLWNFIGQVLIQSKIPPISKSIDVNLAYGLGWLFEKIFYFLGINKPEPPMTRFVALNLGKSHYFSHENARRDFGYVPLISIEEGLKKTFSQRESIK
jgi:nucleoside-diphosphate-sugar epimerase